jgi:hypothetical protein
VDDGAFVEEGLDDCVADAFGAACDVCQMFVLVSIDGHICSLF